MLGPLYVPDGTPVAVGDIVVNPVLAECLAAICEQGSTLLHEGPLGKAVVARLRAGGGFLSEDDFAAHVTAPTELVSTTFRGSTVWELPPPTQGIAVRPRPRRHRRRARRRCRARTTGAG